MNSGRLIVKSLRLQLIPTSRIWHGRLKIIHLIEICYIKIDSRLISIHFSEISRVNTPRKQGGLGKMDIPLLADKTGDIAKAYGVYKVVFFKA